jgi:hypothetical protein
MKIEKWIKRYNGELIELFTGLDILSFIRTKRMNWVGHINKMDSKININQVFNNNSQGSRLSRRPRNRWWNCAQTDINRCKS